MIAVQRWCFTMCALFMLCRRFQVDAYRSDISRSSFSKISPAIWATNIIRDKSTSTSRLEDAEPGFDFTKDEMKKLKIWPGGIIPYYIDEFSFDKVFRDRIRTFLVVTNGITGLNFLELHTPPEEDTTRWVFFINRQGLLNCADHPFKNFTYEGVQKVVLGYDCLTTGGELAEVVLALVGVPPQHNAPNRHLYVDIVKENIMPGKAYLFEIIRDDEWLFHGMNYDYTSASHYPFHKYTINGFATIMPKEAIHYATGEGKGFSYDDIWKIRMLYNYISKKRLKSIKFPECDKLFNVGTNFSRIDPDSDDDVQPRKKPNKYLGLPDDEEKSPHNAIEIPQVNENKDPIENSDEKLLTEGSSENKNIENEEGIVINNDELDDSKEKHEVKNLEENKKESTLTKLKGKAILQLSDYKTGDEYEKFNYHKRRFTKPGGK